MCEKNNGVTWRLVWTWWYYRPPHSYAFNFSSLLPLLYYYNIFMSGCIPFKYFWKIFMKFPGACYVRCQNWRHLNDVSFNFLLFLLFRFIRRSSFLVAAAIRFQDLHFQISYPIIPFTCRKHCSYCSLQWHFTKIFGSTKECFLHPPFTMSTAP